MKYFYAILLVGFLIFFSYLKTEIYFVAAMPVISHFQMENWLWGLFVWGAELPYWVVFLIFLAENLIKIFMKGDEKK
jgi:hypothetical protein